MTADQVRRRAHSAPFLEAWSSRINWSRRSSLSVASDTSSLSSDSDSQEDAPRITTFAPLRRSHRRALLVLFLIALYTTFGLQAPVVVSHHHHTTASEVVVSSPSKPRPLRATHRDSRLTLARRAAEKPLYQKKTELSAFYQQKAFHTNPLDVGFYVNCAALMGIAFWAVAEQRHREHIR